MKEHWNSKYRNNAEEKLGWYETDLSPTIKLVFKANLDKNTRILIVGAGRTTLVDELLDLGYTNLIVSDISDIALEKLKIRVNSEKVQYLVDDLTKPKALKKIENVGLWIDRAVLHFFTEKVDQDSYFELLKNKVESNGSVILAQFSVEGAKRCSGLPIHRYNKEMLMKKLGSKFKLLESFDHLYIMPSGDKRPYIYTLFRKKE